MPRYEHRDVAEETREADEPSHDDYGLLPSEILQASFKPVLRMSAYTAGDAANEVA